MGSQDSEGRNGVFWIRRGKVDFCCIASDGMGWEHVSARAKGLDGKERVPTWEEMCWLKDFFWEPEECVVQFHPKKSEYVNNHPCVLHLWRSTEMEFPQPDSILVGIK